MIRFLNFIIIIITAFICFGLYTITYEAQEQEGLLASVERRIEDERRAIVVLKAEWSHLGQPARIQKLAVQHLGLIPIAASTIASFSDIPDRADDASVIARLPEAHESQALALALVREEAPIVPRRKPHGGAFTTARAE